MNINIEVDKDDFDCSVVEFKDKKTFVHDFGRSSKYHTGDYGMYGEYCYSTHKTFSYDFPTSAFLKKYNIDIDEYKEICNFIFSIHEEIYDE